MESSQAPGENLKENSRALCFTFLYRVLAESAHTWLSLFCYASLVNKLIYTRCGFHQEVPVPFADHKSVIEQVLNRWEVQTQLWRRTLLWLSDLQMSNYAQEHTHPLILLVLLSFRHGFCFPLPLSLSGGESGWLCGCSTCKWSPHVNRLQLPHQLPLFY